MQPYTFFDRDISWLGFNERVLMEAADKTVPLFERIKFLSIFSSNLDEFYRVRIPALMALAITNHKKKQYETDTESLLQKAGNIIQKQLNQYGHILTQEILPALKEKNVHLIYNEPIPAKLLPILADYFYTHILAFLQPVLLSDYSKKCFPENNKLYLLVVATNEIGEEQIGIINIPSDFLPRFFSVNHEGILYSIFLDDVIKANLNRIFPGYKIKYSSSFKITRDAELNLQDELMDDLAGRIEEQIAKRDLGFATRFLYQPGTPARIIQTLIQKIGIADATIVEGGNYHNLKELSSLPLSSYKELNYAGWPAVHHKSFSYTNNIFHIMRQQDIMLHIPYQSYNPVLRFFNEAAIDKDVREIYITMYRVASDSRIANALISAASNGKKVTVFVELKARFDEANNLKWAKKMKAAGIKIIYSIPGLKVHAKIALIKRKEINRIQYYSVLATGNFNESTAKFYTDHILFTTQKNLVKEMELLFIFLAYRKKADQFPCLQFNHLLVAQFNLQQKFISLINREIENANKGIPGRIVIKLNNLEEKVLIQKLYDASNAGVQVQLIVRSICCLIPGVKNMSENITVTRIVDRNLEHGRIFIFHNNGNTEIYMGSADWMNRNIYRRIEVCFPIPDEKIKKQLTEIINIQLSDSVKAVSLNNVLENIPVIATNNPVQSQKMICEYLSNN